MENRKTFSNGSARFPVRKGLQVDDGVFRGLSKQTTKMQIPASVIPSQYISIWYSLFINPERRRGLASIPDNSIAVGGHLGPDEQSE
jgi:hypothetical protein